MREEFGVLDDVSYSRLMLEAWEMVLYMGERSIEKSLRRALP
jgi:hypothetical protein